MIALVLFAVLLAACENDMSKIPQRHKNQFSVAEIKDVESYYSQAGVVKAKLISPIMLDHQADSPYTEFPKTLHVDFFDDSMRIESKMDALYGKYLHYQSLVYLRDSVVVKNIVKGDTLHCDELWWDQRTHKFYTDKAVRINTKDKTLFGKGLEAAENMSWYILKQPTGTILAQDSSLSK